MSRWISNYIIRLSCISKPKFAGVLLSSYTCITCCRPHWDWLWRWGRMESKPKLWSASIWVRIQVCTHLLYPWLNEVVGGGEVEGGGVLVSPSHTIYLSVRLQAESCSFCNFPCMWRIHFLYGGHVISPMIGRCFFFYPRPVLAFGYCRCLRLSVCVCPSVRQSRACPRDNSWPVSARITKFGL